MSFTEYYSCYKLHQELDWNCKCFDNFENADKFFDRIDIKNNNTTIVPILKPCPNIIKQHIIGYKLSPSVFINKHKS